MGTGHEINKFVNTLWKPESAVSSCIHLPFKSLLALAYIHNSIVKWEEGHSTLEGDILL